MNVSRRRQRLILLRIYILLQRGNTNPLYWSTRHNAENWRLLLPPAAIRSLAIAFLTKEHEAGRLIEYYSTTVISHTAIPWGGLEGMCRYAHASNGIYVTCEIRTHDPFHTTSQYILSSELSSNCWESPSWAFERLEFLPRSAKKQSGWVARSRVSYRYLNIVKCPLDRCQ